MTITFSAVDDTAAALGDGHVIVPSVSLGEGYCLVGGDGAEVDEGIAVVRVDVADLVCVCSCIISVTIYLVVIGLTYPRTKCD